MTKDQREKYEPVTTLKEALSVLNGRKFRLDCGHHVTFNETLGNNITIYNGKELRVICAECGY